MLEIKDLSVSYKKIDAVRNISLTVNENEIVSLIGANGAGKSTTLKTISGLLKPKNGKIILNGKDLTDKNPEEIVRAGIVHVPEGRQVFYKMTVLENLLLGGYSVKDKKKVNERISYVYDLFPILKSRIHQKAGSLSGGEQQMLAIGRALISGAETLLLDEPSLGLAPVVVEQVFNVIKQLKASGITILLVEQNANEALAISDRTYIMESGEIALSGTSSDIAADDHVKRIYLGGDA